MLLSIRSRGDIIKAYREILRDPSLNLVELGELSHKIFMGLDTGLVFLYFCREGKATASMLMRDLELPEASVYRALEKLQDLRMVELISFLSHEPKKGGPRKKLWGIVK